VISSSLGWLVLIARGLAAVFRDAAAAADGLRFFIQVAETPEIRIRFLTVLCQETHIVANRNYQADANPIRGIRAIRGSDSLAQ